MGSLALQDAGFQDKSGNWTTLARSFGVNSDSTFRSHPAAQDAAFQNYAERNFEYLHNYRSYLHSTIDGIYITEAGLLAGAHLVGHRDVENFLTSNGGEVAHDGNHVPVTEYLKEFANYHFTFHTVSSGFSDAVDAPAQTASSDQSAPSATRTHEPAPSKPAASHTSADLDMFDTYERLFSHMTGEPTDENILYSSAQAGPDAPELYDQVNAIVVKLFQTERREAPIYPAPGDSAAIPAHGTAPGAPGLPAGSGPSAIATGVDRGDVDRADAGQQPFFPRRRRHVASGHRNDPIFIYTNVNAGGPTGPTQSAGVSLS